MDRLRRFAVVITVGVISLGATSLVNGTTSHHTPVQLKIAATIFPLYDLVRQVAGPDDQVVLIVPAGASPHTFAARPRAIRALADSAVLFAIGHGLDNWATRLAQNVGIKHIVVVDKQVTLRTWNSAHQHEHTAGHRDDQTTTDPHYWLSMPNAVGMVRHIAETLGTLNPAGQMGYRQRAQAYQEQLQALQQNIHHQLSGFARRHIATFHPAFTYFAATYDLHIVATFESSPGREPAPRQVERFLRLIRAQNLRVLFVEPQLPQGPLSTLARDLGVTLSVLDPLGGVQGRDNYIDMMRFNASQVAAALRE
jgi:ABC-type Zn uptake system ZnuABC Zn-binding protein ZnuA